MILENHWRWEVRKWWRQMVCCGDHWRRSWQKKKKLCVYWTHAPPETVVAAHSFALFIPSLPSANSHLSCSWQWVSLQSDFSLFTYSAIVFYCVSWVVCVCVCQAGYYYTCGDSVLEIYCRFWDTFLVGTLCRSQLKVGVLRFNIYFLSKD